MTMKKKIAILIISVFLIINLFVGCAKVHIYTSDGIKAFEKDIKHEYPNISKIQIRSVDLRSFSITYFLTNPASKEDIDKLYKTTKEYINREDFIKAISEDDKVKRDSITSASMLVKNPDVDKEKGYHDVTRVLTKI